MNIMSARQMKRMLADDRALEEEAERYNPVNPKRVLGSRKGRTTLVNEGDEYTGSGATPMLGLSQYRGGNIGLDPASEVGEGLVGSGTKKGQRRKTARKAYSEAYQMGHHLSKHLHGLHGAGFWDDFKSGFMSVVSPVASVAKSLLPLAGPEGAAASGVLGAIGLGKHKRGRGGKRGGMTRRERSPSEELEGSGFLSDLLGNVPIIGGPMASLTGAIGLGKKKRGRGNVSGPGFEAVSGRGKLTITHGGKRHNARAEVVKKVMRDRGVSMIEASKIVKSEGLY